MPTNEANRKDTSLKWDVFITPGIPVVTSTPAPNTKETFWNPTSSTLIYGKRDSVLVDVPTTWQQAITLAWWVRDSCKNSRQSISLTDMQTIGSAFQRFSIAFLMSR